MSATVTINSETEQAIKRFVETGRYRDASAVVESAVAALAAQENAKLERLRELVLAGRNSGSRRELTEEVMDEIERRSEDRYQRGELPSPHVCP